MSTPSDLPPLSRIQELILVHLVTLARGPGLRSEVYRQLRQVVLSRLDAHKTGTNKGDEFNWGFETQFRNEIHALEARGLVTTRKGTSSMLAGRRGDSAIYSVALTEPGKAVGEGLLSG